MCNVVGLLSIETLAERWSIAHTIAATAWAVAIVLGLIFLLRGNAGSYPATDRLKAYAAENATFTYPENWIINNCESGKPFIELPGTIKTNYKRKGYELKMYGTTAYNCIKDRPERLDLYQEAMRPSNQCNPATSTEGERLSNGLYLQLHEEQGDVLAVHIKQNSCYAPADTMVLGFGFIDPDPQAGDSVEFGIPRVDKETFLKSRQYQDIRALAESIKY